jgi:hypothetical protein
MDDGIIDVVTKYGFNGESMISSAFIDNCISSGWPVTFGRHINCHGNLSCHVVYYN